jgi:hypothetical protein
MKGMKVRVLEWSVSALQSIYLKMWARWVNAVDPVYIEEDETVEHAYVRMVKEVAELVK